MNAIALHRGKRSIYCFLLLCGMLTAVCQVIYTGALIHWLNNAASMPEVPVYVDGRARVTFMQAEAERAGIQPGDVLLGIQNQPILGMSTLQRAVASAHPGQFISMQIRGAAGVVKNCTVRLVPISEGPLSIGERSFAASVFIFGPMLAILLSFAAVYLRTQEATAWILFCLLISFSQILIRPGLEGYLSPWLLEYRSIVASTFGLNLFLFGTHFPSKTRFDRVIPWLRWMVGSLFFAVILIARTSKILTDLRQPWLAGWLATGMRAQRWQVALTLLAAVYFVLRLANKIREAASSDERRRLIILWTGMLIGLSPLAILMLRGLIRHEDPFLGVPSWLLLPSVLCLELVPCTMAYVVIVRRAMALPVLLREIVRVLLARRNLTAVRLLLLSASFLIFFERISHPASKRIEIEILFVIVTITISAELLLSANGAQWLEKSFFRGEFETAKRIVNAFASVNCADTTLLIQTLDRTLGDNFHSRQLALFLRRGDSLVLTHVRGVRLLNEPSLSARSHLQESTLR